MIILLCQIKPSRVDINSDAILSDEQLPRLDLLELQKLPAPRNHERAFCHLSNQP